MCHKDLVDARTIHINDFKGEVTPPARLGFFWYITKVRGQKAAHRLEMRLILIWQRRIDIEFFLEVINGKQAVHIPGIFAARNHLRRIELIAAERFADDQKQIELNRDNYLETWKDYVGLLHA